MEVRTPSRPYRQVARAQATKQTRLALFDAARQVFFTGRLDETSLEEIAAMADTTKQTLLRHFGSRQGLVDAASHYWTNQLLEGRNQAPAGDIPGIVDVLLSHYDDVGDAVLRLLAMEDRSEGTARSLQAGREYHYAWVERVFAPWLEPLPRAARERRRAALIAACDVYTWKILARDLRMRHADVRKTLAETLDRIAGEEA